jgi:hypothetical protein
MLSDSDGTGDADADARYFSSAAVSWGTALRTMPNCGPVGTGDGSISCSESTWVSLEPDVMPFSTQVSDEPDPASAVLNV